MLYRSEGLYLYFCVDWGCVCGEIEVERRCVRCVMVIFYSVPKNRSKKV